MSGPPVRIVFLGMGCDVSAIALRSLIDGGFELSMIFLAGASPSDRDPVATLAALHAVPLQPISGVSREQERQLIATQRPDLIVASCFPWKLPAIILNLPRFGCINVHPSLLPVGRGPEPVFWTLRRGDRETGTTIHLMDEGLDSGPILSQARFAVPSGIRAPDLERQLATLGADLLRATIRGLVAGTLQPHPQSPTGVTAAPVPTADDFLVPTNLPAAWAYDFVRGVHPLDGPLAVWIGATRQRIPIGDALGWNDAPMAEPFIITNSTVTVRFMAGHVTFQRPIR